MLCHAACRQAILIEDPMLTLPRHAFVALTLLGAPSALPVLAQDLPPHVTVVGRGEVAAKPDRSASRVRNSVPGRR
jgi:hypothetical protein